MQVKVIGMSCAHCTNAVKSALEELGLKDVSVDLNTGTAEFTEDTTASIETIHEAIKEAGYEIA